MKLINKSKQAGFGIIEVMIGAILLGVIVTVVNTVLFSSFRGVNKSNVLTEVKQNGDYAISVMERMIREAKQIVSVCDGTPLSELAIVNYDPDAPSSDDPTLHTTTFKCDLNSGVLRIASASAVEDLLLTSSANVTLEGTDCTSAISFVCSQVSADQPPVVNVSFTLKQKSPAGVTPRVDERAQIDFSTTVVLRDY